MSEHIKEPISYCEQTGRPGHCLMAQLFDADGMSIALMEPTPDPRTATESARRIVACVNACAGIDDPQAWIDSARFYSHETVSAITQQRDDLLAALKECDEAMCYMSEYDIPIALPERVKEAIARAEGREARS